MWFYFSVAAGKFLPFSAVPRRQNRQFCRSRYLQRKQTKGVAVQVTSYCSIWEKTDGSTQMSEPVRTGSPGALQFKSKIKRDTGGLTQHRLGHHRRQNVRISVGSNALLYDVVKIAWAVTHHGLRKVPPAVEMHTEKRDQHFARLDVIVSCRVRGRQRTIRMNRCSCCNKTTGSAWRLHKQSPFRVGFKPL